MVKIDTELLEIPYVKDKYNNFLKGVNGRPGIDYLLVTAIEKQETRRNLYLIDGYKLSGDILVNFFIENREKNKSLIQPIIFNYRHFIELSLKYLIKEIACATGIKKNLTGHRLKVLMKKVIVELKKNNKNNNNFEEEEYFIHFKKIVMWFDRIDENSIIHRYTVETNGEPVEVTDAFLDVLSMRFSIEYVYNCIIDKTQSLE